VGRFCWVGEFATASLASYFNNPKAAKSLAVFKATGYLVIFFSVEEIDLHLAFCQVLLDIWLKNGRNRE